MRRIGYVAGIYKALQILYADPAQADGWVQRPNRQLRRTDAARRAWPPATSPIWPPCAPISMPPRSRPWSCDDGVRHQRRAVSWSRATRIVAARYPPIDLFERVSPDPAVWEALIAAEQLVNPRVRDEVGEIRLVAPEERVSGPGASWVMAAFTHRNPAGSRFSDGSYGVYYAARELRTAVRETAFHFARFAARQRRRAALRGHARAGRAHRQSLRRRGGAARRRARAPAGAGLVRRQPAVRRRACAPPARNGLVYPSVRDAGGRVRRRLPARQPSACRCRARTSSTTGTATAWRATSITSTTRGRRCSSPSGSGIGRNAPTRRQTRRGSPPHATAVHGATGVLQSGHDHRSAASVAGLVSRSGRGGDRRLERHRPRDGAAVRPPGSTGGAGRAAPGAARRGVAEERRAPGGGGAGRAGRRQRRAGGARRDRPGGARAGSASTCWSTTPASCDPHRWRRSRRPISTRCCASISTAPCS